MAAAPPRWLLSRDESVGEKFEQIMNQDPLGASVNSDAVVIAIGTSLAVTGAIFLAFLLLRPFNTIVYAPRLRHADERHRPPPLDKSLFAWYKPVFKTNEDYYVEKIGLDATVFLRFARMCRNMFITLAVFGCAIIIPVNITNQIKTRKIQNLSDESKFIFVMMTPSLLTGQVFWAFVVVAYVFDIIVCGYLWWTYRAVHRLRRRYMDSAEYQNSLHARTLMVTDISKDYRSDQGLLEITDSLKTTPEVPRTTIGRNMKDIPDLIESHEEAVMELEAVLSRYLKNPDQLPAQRPLCTPSKKDPEFTDKKQKVDAIDYLTARIQRLETKIKEARETVDNRDAMPFGFASYETLESAHTVAFVARSKHPKATTVRLAPKPKDIIWKNLLLNPKQRRWRRFINNVWITLLTVLYFIPNAGIAIFLSKLNNLALLWDTFNTEMHTHPKFWAVVQGVLAPALTSLFYYFLPIIFRRLSMKAGDQSKSSREKHVIHQLYAFFVFNNLVVFSIFSAVFKIITSALAAAEGDSSFVAVVRAIEPFQQLMGALCDVSGYWVTWLVQRNLGAVIDLSQAVNLAWGSFSRKFLNPTPRELIQRTAPPPFDYTSYYNYFLFYSTVTLIFGMLQPVTLVVTAFYFTLDSWMKKYLLMYVFYTKNETGGLFWRVLFNRMLFGAFLANVITACLVSTKGGVQQYMMAAAMAPLPFLLLGFKFYCKKTYDHSMKYYTQGNTNKGAEAQTPIDKESRRRDRVATRFGHPALYQKLTVPMVSEKSKHLLAEVYRGRLDGDVGDNAAFSDVYSMKRMSKENPGKIATSATGPFEFVSENNMDYENFKDRSEFNSDRGSMYGESNRPDSPSTLWGDDGRGRSSSRGSTRAADDNGVTYPAGYHQTPSNLREYSPSPEPELRHMESNSSQPYQLHDDHNLLSGAAPMGHQTPAGYTPYSPERDGERRDEYFRR
ncbi:uncharacterized protein EKO05_0004743 [Ascochyta rabiei]|uniref:Membrane protein n=1 Tax=Didymella rabiei TaxID=5454 RepID=A0A163KFX5_DIDRA|nr:uncharacterized protein EKO05_0004743 [Ascochyta rabiei]KZM26972.1 membrane protein [Ascochyta rabiei]UPX14254.1 hypothetical protein EKO05_0004743 [Ascochyta rabiei]